MDPENVPRTEIISWMSCILSGSWLRFNSSRKASSSCWRSFFFWSNWFRTLFVCANDSSIITVSSGHVVSCRTYTPSGKKLFSTSIASNSLANGSKGSEACVSRTRWMERMSSRGSSSLCCMNSVFHVAVHQKSLDVSGVLKRWDHYRLVQGRTQASSSRSQEKYMD